MCVPYMCEPVRKQQTIWRGSIEIPSVASHWENSEALEYRAACPGVSLAAPCPVTTLAAESAWHPSLSSPNTDSAAALQANNAWLVSLPESCDLEVAAAPRLLRDRDCFALLPAPTDRHALPSAPSAALVAGWGCSSPWQAPSTRSPLPSPSCSSPPACPSVAARAPDTWSISLGPSSLIAPFWQGLATVNFAAAMVIERLASTLR
mmetsp:Transcript_21214/g.49805  ORF Transcript_21214/g.49805 Transcript_21214/m.49805 type:complete len:206 (+) Transcript_21214:744-1361(+)